MPHTHQAYEDNAGGLHLFALAENGAPVWGDYYHGDDGDVLHLDTGM